MRNRLTVFVAASMAGMILHGALRAAEVNSSVWEKDIAAFEAMDKTNPPPKDAVLFLGSSSIRLWPRLAHDFPGMKVIQRGFGGSKMPDATYYADRIVIPYQPAKIVLYEGDNDIAAGRSPEQVAEDFKAFARKVQAALPNTEIYFLAIKPSPSRWHLSPQSEKANQLVRRFCRMHRKLAYVDTWKPILGADGKPDAALFKSDKLHLNEEGYARWVPVIRAALKE